MLFDFSNVLLFLILGIIFVPLVLWLGKFVRPHNPTPEKLATYECGDIPIGSPWIQFNIRFYIIAMLFLIFDVEVAFIYPCATVFKAWVLSPEGKGWAALIEIGVFIAILFLALIYAWKKKDLEWVKVLKRSHPERSEGSRRIRGDPSALPQDDRAYSG